MGARDAAWRAHSQTPISIPQPYMHIYTRYDFSIYIYCFGLLWRYGGGDACDAASSRVAYSPRRIASSARVHMHLYIVYARVMAIVSNKMPTPANMYICAMSCIYIGASRSAPASAAARVTIYLRHNRGELPRSGAGMHFYPIKTRAYHIVYIYIAAVKFMEYIYIWKPLFGIDLFAMSAASRSVS